MRLLIDSDVFCKLGCTDLFEDSIRLVGSDLGDCARLPALPHMLRAGRLRKAYGESTCDGLIPLASSIQPIERVDPRWLDQLTPIAGIDPGEALLLAAAAESGGMIMTGDVRSLRELKRLDQFVTALQGRIVLLEAILLSLCVTLGTTGVRARIGPLVSRDRVVRVCFSSGTSNPREGLRSYLDSRVRELNPLQLWTPVKESEQ